MTIRILPAVGDLDAARSITTLLGQLPETEPANPRSGLDLTARSAGPARRRVDRRTARGRPGP